MFGVESDVNRLKTHKKKNQNRLVYFYKRVKCCNLAPVDLKSEVENVTEPIQNFSRPLLLREICMFYL